MYVIMKTCTGSNGNRFKKILTGKSRICAEFTRLPDAVNVITWKTIDGPRKFMAERPTFKSGHEAKGDLVTIDLYDRRMGRPLDETIREVRGGRVTISKDGDDLWSVNIYRGEPSREVGKYGEWMSGRVFERQDLAHDYFSYVVTGIRP